MVFKAFFKALMLNIKRDNRTKYLQIVFMFYGWLPVGNEKILAIATMKFRN